MIILPWPAKELSPNARGHWAPKARAARKARMDAFYATKAAKVGIVAGEVPITLRIEFCPPDKRKRDADNMLASCKNFFDGIADALSVNDSFFRHQVFIAEPVKGGRVTVSIL